MRFGQTDEVIELERREMDAVKRHLQQFEKLVKAFEIREQSGSLNDGWETTWTELKAFLQSEELEGSEIPDAVAADGRYCCQWRTRGLQSGIRDCHQYDAWYIFA